MTKTIGIFLIFLLSIIFFTVDSIIAGTCTCSNCRRQNMQCGYMGISTLPTDCEFSAPSAAACNGCQGTMRTSGCTYTY